MKWVEVQVCLDCALVVAVVSEQPDRGWVYVNATESKFCPRCGAAHGAVSDPKPARLRVAFWVSTARWWNPLTWGSGHFMLREDYLAQQDVQTELAKVRRRP